MLKSFSEAIGFPHLKHVAIPHFDASQNITDILSLCWAVPALSPSCFSLFLQDCVVEAIALAVSHVWRRVVKLKVEEGGSLELPRPFRAYGFQDRIH